MLTARQVLRDMKAADREKIIDYLRQNHSSRKIFKHDFTKQFYDDLTDRRDNKIKQNCVMFIFGYTGTMKSGVGIEIGRFVNHDFSAKNIAFTDTELLSIVEGIKEHEYVMRDECLEEFGYGSNRNRSFIQMQAETLRQHQTWFTYISPSLKLIGTEHYVLHTIGHNKFKVDDEGNPTEPVFVLLGAINPITNNYLGGVFVEIEWMNKVWIQYQNKKNEFLQKVRERKFSKANFFEMAEKVLQHPKSQYAKTKYEWFVIIQEIYPDLTTEEVKMLYATIKLNKRIDL
jgi:hypothetical protein